MACLSVSGHRFLGASITGINTSLGWGSNGTSLTVSLVEDTCNGDNFSPPLVGSPVCVNVGNGGWNFGGFLDSWEFKSSVSAGHTFDAKIVDPTDLLMGYQVVLANYDGGTFGVPNLANVFGYLENYLGGPCVDFLSGDSSGVNYTPAHGWGGSHINSGGVPATLVVSALSSILNGGGGTFGTLAYYRTNSYYIDLSRLSLLPTYNYNYRIAGDNMSVHDIIDRMCKDSGYDYYYGLDCAGTTVSVYPIPINYFGGFGGANSMDVAAGDIDAGDIAQIAGQGVYYSNKSIGLDHRKETLNAFTVGDNFQGIHSVNAVATCSPVNATIWPYWGNDWTDTPILGSGCNDEHCFMADSREWNVAGIGAFYELCVAEIRAAFAGQDQWKSWMAINKRNLLDDLDPDFDFLDLLQRAAKRPLKPQDVKDPNKAKIDGANKRLNEANGALEKNVTNLFNAIKALADEFYGKKYMVVIPFICKYLEDETGELKTNWEKSDSGWSEIGIIGLTNPSLGLLVFKDEQGKIGCFVRYDNADELDLTGLQKGDFYFESGYVWIKANVQKLVQTGGKFWAVIDLKTRVMMAKGKDDDNVGMQAFLDLIKDAQDAGDIDQAAHDVLRDELPQDVNGKILYVKAGPKAVIPYAAAIPLKSTKVSYGPWYAGFLGGKTEYGRDTNFSPWNFGAVSQMQAAGSIHTIFKATTVEVAEKGSVTAAGYPVAFLADRASRITGTGNFGPIITDINVKHDTSGISTTYGFKTFTPKWGQLSKNIIDGMQRRGQAVHKQAHDILQRLLEPPPPNSAIYRMRIQQLEVLRADNPGKDKNNSTHDMFMSSTASWTKADYAAADWTGSNAVAGYQNMVTGKWEHDFCWLDAVAKDALWVKTAGVEPVGIFRPFSTNENATMSSFETAYGNEAYMSGPDEDEYGYNEGASFADGGQANTNKFYPRAPEPPVGEEYNMPITIKTLNPFKDKGGEGIFGFEHMNDSESMRHDIDFVVRGETFPTDVGIGGVGGSEHYRSISLRGPLIITGWGFDLDGKPVPAQKPATDKPQFLDDWLKKPDKWKTGALDVRWDEERGLWVAPPSFKLVNAKCCECVGPKNTDTGWFQLTDDDQEAVTRKFDKDGEPVDGTDDGCNCDTDGKKQVMAINKTGKVILPDAKVLLYFDTRHHKYHIITAPDPIVIAKMDKLMMPEETTATATIEKGIHDLGTFDEDCGRIVQVTNTLKQPICADSKAFIYLTVCESSASDGGSGDYDFKGEILQAEFEPLTVVTSVDCYESSDTGEPTLEICDRRIYVQTAYTIEDCGDDDPKKRFDTKGWRPETDEDNKKNEKPDEADLCPSDWNKIEIDE